jgi:toxin CcdB
MPQFDVFQNPIVPARNAYPWVVVLQSEFANVGPERIVAPLVPRAGWPRVPGRLTPVVPVTGIEHLVLIPALTGVSARELDQPVGSLGASSVEILAAIDYLFFGV